MDDSLSYSNRFHASRVPLTSPFHGINPRTNEFFIANWGLLGGGWGAKRSEDGVSATVCMNDGDDRGNRNVGRSFPSARRARVDLASFNRPMTTFASSR
jgi:hypothetical protein